MILVKYLLKKYGLYLLLALAAILAIFQIFGRKAKKTSAKPVTDYVAKAKDAIEEVNTTYRIEKAIAKQKADSQKEQLKDIQAIKEGKERRKRLAEMLAKVASQ